MFTRDLVIFDIETTGLDVLKHEVIQIAGILLDKDTLAEKDRFTTYIKPLHWEVQLPEAMEVNKITYDKLQDAPSMVVALQEFEKHFQPGAVLLAAYNAWFDTGFLRQNYHKMGKLFPYEYHTFDIWPLAYYYWCNVPHKVNLNKPIGFGLSDIAGLLGIESSGEYHEALTDCKATAEVLRRLLKKINL